MPKSTLYAFILSFFAGISTIIGYLVTYINTKDKYKLISFSLSFAAGVMICVSIIDLIPNSYNLIINSNNIFLKINILLIFIIMGIIISMTIDKYIPNNSSNTKSNIYKIGIISMIAIIIHNIPEGIATFITTSNNIKLGISLVIAITLHNIPEGISISVPIYSATKNRKKAFFYTLISGMSEFLGSILAFIFLKPYINKHILGSLYAIIAGIMVHISFYELIPYSFNKIKIKHAFLYLFLGILVMFLSHILIK